MMKKALIAVFALGLLLFAAPANTTQDVTVAKETTVINHPIWPPV
ncbi:MULTISPECIES: hypothetical protein [Bacillaceae]|nr:MULTISPECIES: hypothetical protein [Bacillaceae]